MRHAFVMTLGILWLSCSNGNFTGDKKADGFRRETLLSLVGFTGSVVKAEKRFAGYTKSAKRISLVDPSTEKEVWGRQLTQAFERAMPLPDYGAVALFAERQLTIVAPDSERSFLPVPFAVGFFSAARAAATYVAVSLDGRSLRLVRSLPGGEWQEVSIGSPWDDLGGFKSPPGDEPPLSTALLSADGTRLVWFVPADGRFATYAATDAGSPLKVEPELVCAGDGEGTAEKASFRSAAYDDALGLVYAGDLRGRIVMLDPKACVAAAAWPTVTLADGYPITDVSVSGAGRLGVTQAGARAHTLRFEGAAFLDVVSYEKICDYPLGLLTLSEQRLLAICYDLSGASAENDEGRDTHAVISYSKAHALVLDVASRRPVLDVPLQTEKTAGMAVDGDRILTLKDSALGVLEITSLVDGSVRARKGLFLSKILD